MEVYDPRRRWIDHPRRACKGTDIEDWFAGSVTHRSEPAPGVRESWEAAKAICRHCPVLKKCQRDTLGEEHGVWGGRDPQERHEIRKRLHRSAQRWPKARRLAWGKAVVDLRGPEWAYSAIRVRTGLPSGLARELAAEYEAHVEAEREKAARRAEAARPSIPAPAERPVAPFPETPGNKDCWIRRWGAVQDADYKAHSPSGKWILVQVNTSKGHTQVWIESKDVRLYRAVRKEVKAMAGRKIYGQRERKREDLTEVA